MTLFFPSNPSTRGHTGFFSSVFGTRVGRSRIISNNQLEIENSCAKYFLFILFFALFIGGPLALFYAENESAMMIRAFNELSDEAVIVNDPIFSKPSESNNGKLIFFHVPSDHVHTDSPIVDHDFGLSFNGALSVKRNVEYCQWMETSKDETVKNRDGSETTVRTYYYTKGWVDHLIPSFAFDQPAAHHNPQRNPFPSTLKHASGVSLAKYHIGPSLITKNQIPERTIEFSKSQLESIRGTPANTQHNFKYIGSGYFFSAHEPSTFEKTLRTVFGFVEGSLLDWQLADLFSTCEAGDIRIKFIDKKPALGKGLSVIGRQVSTNGEIELLKASNGYNVGEVHEGQYNSPRDLFDNAIGIFRWSLSGLLGARLLIIVWAIVVSLVMLGDHIVSGSDLFLSTISLSSIMIGLVWLSLILSHGSGSDIGFTSVFLCFVVSGFTGYVITNNKESPTSSKSK